MRHAFLKALALAVVLAAVPALAGPPPDGLLTSQTKLTLWTTAGIRSTAVHVDVNDGVVTLYGKVQTAEQKALAEKTARGVGGVRDVKNLIQIVPVADEKRVAASDKEISISAEKQLKADPALRDSKISVKAVDKGVVMLTGEARSISDHVRAVLVVDRVPGVVRISSDVKGPDGFTDDERLANRPTAKPEPSRSSASDMRVTTVVKLRLFSTSQVPSGEISVDTEDGVVTLFGIVPTAEVKKAAGVEAGKVTGVLRVDNELEVVPTSLKKVVDARDSDISRDLALVFKDRPELKRVETTTKNGTVRLTGSVTSDWDELNAVRLARQVAGVHGIENQLKVVE